MQLKRRFRTEMLRVLTFVSLLISFSEISALWPATIDCGDGIICYYAESGLTLYNYVTITFCDFELSLTGDCTGAEEALKLYVPQDSCTGENEMWSRKARSISCDCRDDKRRDSYGNCITITESTALLAFFNKLTIQNLITSINNSPAIYNCGLFVALAILLPIGLYFFHRKISKNFSKSLAGGDVIQT